MKEDAKLTWPADLLGVKGVLDDLDLWERLGDLTWWKALHRQVEGTAAEGNLAFELVAYITWNLAAGSRRHRNLKRGFRNWITRGIRQAGAPWARWVGLPPALKPKRLPTEEELKSVTAHLDYRAVREKWTVKRLRKETRDALGMDYYDCVKAMEKAGILRPFPRG